MLSTYIGNISSKANLFISPFTTEAKIQLKCKINKGGGHRTFDVLIFDVLKLVGLGCTYENSFKVFCN